MRPTLIRWALNENGAQSEMFKSSFVGLVSLILC